MEYVLYNYIK
jgi:hypothetical protein